MRMTEGKEGKEGKGRKKGTKEGGLEVGRKDD